MKLLYFLIFIFMFFSCENNGERIFKRQHVSKRLEQKGKVVDYTQKQNYISEKKEKLLLQSQIATKYGQQYTFCECIQKGDSLNKALKNQKLSEKALDQLLIRFEEIDKKCQAFRLNDANATPRERQQYKKKVKECLQ